MNIKLIVTDLDRTLLRSDKTISDYTVGIFAKCRERGIKLAFATARPYTGVVDYEAKIRPNDMILTNGALTVVEGRQSVGAIIPPRVFAEFVASLLAHPTTKSVSARGLRAQYTNSESKYRKKLGTTDLCYFTDFTEPPPEDIIHLSTHNGDPEFMENLAKRFPKLAVWHVGGEDLYDINPVSSTKSNAITYVADKLGVSTADIAAFGDDINDLEMLQTAGVGVAVENAIDEIKAAAHFVCPSNDEDGVARWIEENVL